MCSEESKGGGKTRKHRIYSDDKYNIGDCWFSVNVKSLLKVFFT
jgi:hypothetical protein